MKINIRFAACQEYLGKMENGDYEMPEGFSIFQALKVLEEQSDMDFREDICDYIAFMINGRSAQPKDILSDGDSLIILRKIYGG